MNDTAIALPAEEVERLDARFPQRLLALDAQRAQVAVRECGNAAAGLPIVCLHGIGSGAASWLDAALALAPQARVIAWDAPGYGASTPLSADVPAAADYAQRLESLLETLGVERCVLVGHSLGALPAAAAARGSRRVAALALISPAQGYGAPGREAERARVHAERLGSLAELGIGGMAAKRSARLVSEHASPTARAWVRWNMSRLNERGYRQAIELLCGGTLLADLPPAMPVAVACGALDVVTPPAACAEVAKRAGVDLHTFAEAGHACYVERPAEVAAWLASVRERAAH